MANKLDVERSDYDAVAKQLEESLETRVVKLHLPLGSGPDYSGYVDLDAVMVPNDEGNGWLLAGASQEIDVAASSAA